MQPSKKTEEDHPRAQACHASLTSPVLGHPTIPRNYLRTAPDSWGFKTCSKIRLSSRCCSDRARITTVHQGQVGMAATRKIAARRPPNRALPAGARGSCLSLNLSGARWRFQEIREEAERIQESH